MQKGSRAFGSHVYDEDSGQAVNHQDHKHHHMTL